MDSISREIKSYNITSFTKTDIPAQFEPATSRIQAWVYLEEVSQSVADKLGLS
jgi:hypothetical protein